MRCCRSANPTRPYSSNQADAWTPPSARASVCGGMAANHGRRGVSHVATACNEGLRSGSGPDDAWQYRLE
jgi:hypothetical protein